MTAMSVSAVHADARERGARPWLYAVVRGVLWLFVHTWFRVTVDGATAVPASGPVIVAPNHKSVVDAFLVGLATRRRVRFMAKTELFRPPLGGLLVRLGAFPVRRGEHDDEAMQTARILLARGEALVLFPEGTRVEDADALGSPHHGAARLAIETGTPIVPAAISGTGHLWLGPVPKPRSLHLSALAPVTPDGSDAFAIIDQRVWPAVLDEYGRLRATPGVVATALAAVGLGGLAARRARRARRPPALLGVLEPRRVRRRRRGRRPGRRDGP
jgi:1-acyl-sn-glycerol-3-phosphate acyltransferase